MKTAALQGMCRNGHPRTEENTVVPLDGRPRCRECARERSRRHEELRKAGIPGRSAKAATVRACRQRKVAFVDRFKAERGCAVCGEQDVVVLDLDHRDPRTKHPRLRRPARGGIRQLAELSWADLFVELEKCDVLCANDHRRKTAEKRDRSWREMEEVTG